MAAINPGESWNGHTHQEVETYIKQELEAERYAVKGVKVNNSELTIDSNRKVNITVIGGSVAGTLKVNGTDIAVKDVQTKVTSATSGHLAGLNSRGMLTDSGKGVDDFAAAGESYTKSESDGRYLREHLKWDEE